jgi:hypothetical protein
MSPGGRFLTLELGKQFLCAALRLFSRRCLVPLTYTPSFHGLQFSEIPWLVLDA